MVEPLPSNIQTGRKARTRAGTFVQQICALPKAQIRAALLMVDDLVTRSFPAAVGWIIERCASYWVPDGRISKLISQLIFPFVYDSAGAEKISAAQARDFGYPVRKVVAGQGRGSHWLLPAWGLELLQEAILALKVMGYEPEIPRISYELSPTPVTLSISFKGRRSWLNCPEHQDSNPSALINPSGVVWCFACARVVGIAGVEGSIAQYRKVLGVKQPQTIKAPPTATGTSPAPGAPPAPQPPPSHIGGFFCAPPVSPVIQPYSLSRVLEAGSPGDAPHRPQGSRPTGLQILDPGAECFILPQPLGLVLGRRYADQPLDRYHRTYGLSRSYSSCMDLLDVLRTANRQLAGPGADARAFTGSALAEQHSADPRHWLPDLYVSLDYQGHAGMRAFPARNSAVSANIVQPTDFFPICTTWVGVDIDGITDWPTHLTLIEAGKQIQATLEKHPAFSGRMGLVRTSFRGAQIVAQLSIPRWDPLEFYGATHVQRMLAGLDATCLRLLEEHGVLGGYADPTVHSAGRFIRRPGPRVDKSGSPTVSKLIWATP